MGKTHLSDGDSTWEAAREQGIGRGEGASVSGIELGVGVWYTIETARRGVSFPSNGPAGVAFLE